MSFRIGLVQCDSRGQVLLSFRKTTELKERHSEIVLESRSIKARYFCYFALNLKCKLILSDRIRVIARGEAEEPCINKEFGVFDTISSLNTPANFECPAIRFPSCIVSTLFLQYQS